MSPSPNCDYNCHVSGGFYPFVDLSSFGRFKAQFFEGTRYANFWFIILFKLPVASKILASIELILGDNVFCYFEKSSPLLQSFFCYFADLQHRFLNFHNNIFSPHIQLCVSVAKRKSTKHRVTYIIKGITKITTYTVVVCQKKTSFCTTRDAVRNKIPSNLGVVEI